jgi:type II secretory pathway component GspD/PulD (secretin)
MRRQWRIHRGCGNLFCMAAALMALLLVQDPFAMGYDVVSDQNQSEQDKDKGKEEKAAPAPRKGPRRSPNDARSTQAPAKDETSDKKPSDKEKEPADEGLQIDPELQKQIDQLLQDAAQRDPSAQQAQQPEEDPRERMRRLREERMQQMRSAQGQPVEGQVPDMPGTVAPDEPDDSQPIDIPPHSDGIPPEARTYRFSIRDGSYDQLVEGFARQTGLGVIGDAPRDGRVNFVTTEELSFAEALSRVRMLLFNYKPHDPYWVERRDTHLEVIRVTDFYRVLPTGRMFQSIELFREAQLPPDELALVIYTPRSGSVADLSVVRDFMPDYMRVTPLQDRNAVTIFGLVKDIEKYMSLKDIFTGDRTDPRTLARLEVVNLMPSEALEKLRQMTDIDGASLQRPRAIPSRGQPTSPLDSVVEPPVVIIPEDMQGYLMVRAMQDKIEEIRSLLTFIDVPTPISDVTPEIIPLTYASADMLVQTLQQILSATAPSPTPGVQPAPRRPRRSVQRGSSAGAVSSDSVTLMPHPSKNAIIVLADSQDQVRRVRELVALFDVESKIGPLRIELSYADPTEVANMVTSVLGGPGGPKGAPGAGSMQMQIFPDPSGTAIWFSGSQAALDDVRSIIAALDLPAEPVSLHVYRLKNRLPSFVANMLREYDGAVLQPQSAAARTGRSPSARQARRVRRAAPVASKFTADDDEMRLLVLCSEAEWQEYLTIIEKLEESVDPQNPFERVTLKHLDPEAAIERLNVMVTPIPGPASAMRFVPSEGSILVIDSTPAQLDQVRAFVQEIDVPWTIEQRIFEIKHKDPAEIRAAIEALIATPTVPTRSAGRRRVPNVPGAQPQAGPPTVSEGLTIVELGNKLIIRATPATLDEVAALIAQFDVADTQTEMRVYGDFPAGTDILSLSETVKTIVAGGSGASRPRRAPVPEAAGETVRFVPYPPSNKLIVIAEPSMFVEIERVLELFRAASDAPPIEVAFVKLKYGDPAEVIEQVGPLLDIKIRRMVQAGEMDLMAESATAPTPAVPGGSTARRRVRQPSGVAAGDRYHLAADVTNQRIVIAAQRSVIDVATDLINQFDMPTEEDEIVFETVTLNNSDSALMVKAVKEMIGSSVRTSRRRSVASGGPATPDLTGVSLTVTEAPTGGAIILRGTRSDVDEAIAWIKRLDSMVTSGQVIKVFEIRKAEIKSLVELILHMVDTGPRPQTARPVAPARRPSPALGGLEGDSEESVWETSKTWTAPDLFVQADLIDRTLLVATTESRMAKIETIIRQVDEDESITSVMEETKVPSFAYDLQFADPIDATWDADSVFREFFDSDKRPKCRSAMFSDNVIICEHPDESEFDHIRSLIRDYVDKPSKKDLEMRTLSVRRPEGISAEEVVRRIIMSRPEVDIDVTDITKAEVDYDIEEIKAYRPAKPAPKKEENKQRSESSPNGCVLPGAFGRMVNELALSLSALDDDPPPDEEEEYPEDDEEQADEPESEDLPPTQDEMIRRMVQSQFVPATGERAEPQEPQDDEEEPASARLPAEAQKLQVYFDNIAGVLVFKGPKALVDEMKDVIKDIEAELEKFVPPPDIRIYRVRYIDVFTARDIIEEMFNATRMQRDMVQQQQQLQMMRIQQLRATALARQRAIQQAQQQGARGQQPGQPGRPGEEGEEDQEPQLETPQLPPTTVRVYPNPRDRTLILRADASQYPAILELLAKIDQPKPFDSELKIFTLQKLNAIDVEEMLKNILGIGGPSARRTPTAPTRPQRGAAAQMGPSATAGSADALPRTILQEVATGTGMLGIDPEDITLSSSEESNSIIVMAPPRAIEFIGELIEKLESEDIPTRELRYFELAHAPVEEVVDYLTEHFEQAGTRTVARGAEGQRTARGARTPATTSGGLNAPTFLAYPRLNLLTVQAPVSVLDEVADLIAKLDVDSAQEQWEDIVLKHADAKLVADTLSQMFGEGAAAGAGRRSGAGQSAGMDRSARFIGEEGGRIVLYRAPTALHGQIQDAVAKLEETAKQTSSIHVLTLENAIPSRIAEAIESAYGAGRGAGARRGAAATSQFTVTAHDASKQLFVRTDEAMFAEIESLVKSLDTPSSLGFDFRIYPLQFADAREVHTTMTQLVRGYLTQLGPAAKDVAPFSVEVNEAANALIVLGGPQVFGFLEENLKKIDNPAAAQQREVHVVTLTTADAASVAKTLTDIFITGAGQRPGGTAPPAVSISAVQGSPTLLIKCSKDLFAQIEPIVAQLDSEEAAAGEVRVVSLLYSDANEMNKALQETLQKQGGARGAGQQLVGGVRVSPLAQGNALVISGNKEQVDNLEATIQQLDAAGEKGSVPQIIVLQHARVAHVLPTLQEMFGQRTGGPRNQPPPVIASNDPLNALVIRASQTDMAAIEGMVARIDTPDFPSQPGIRVVQLQQGINITDLAEKVEASVNSGAKARDAKSQKTITITPDTRTNSLILSGSGELFAEAEELARTMEEMGPSGGRETRIITVQNVQVDEIERLIEQLTGQSAGTSGRSGARSGAGTTPRPRQTRPAARPQR